MRKKFCFSSAILVEQEKLNNEIVMNILIFFASGLGDALFIAPAVFALKHIYPEARITAAVPHLRSNRFLQEKVLPFDEVLCLKRPKKSSIISWFRYVANFFKLLRVFRAGGYDRIVATVQARLPDQYLLMLLSGAEHRVGPEYWRGKKNYYRFILTDATKPDRREHIYFDHSNLLLDENESKRIDKYVPDVTEALKRQAGPFDWKGTAKQLVLVFPGSGSQSYKRWPFEKFLNIIEYLISKYKCDVAVIGGRKEYDETIIPTELRNKDGFHNLADGLDLSEIIRLLERSVLVLSNDNGLLHLAEFMDVPTVGIYPMNWEYVSQKYAVSDSTNIIIPFEKEDRAVGLLRKNPGRTRKLKKICSRVIRDIEPEEVIMAIDDSGLLRQETSS